jgi:RES domain-containing protein
VTGELDEDVVERVNTLGGTAWSGRTFRYSKHGRDPLSGVGARLFGGRWNPRDVFPAVYLATPRGTAMRELDRSAEAAGVAPAVLLQAEFDLHTVDVSELRVLDLRDAGALAYVGLSDDDIRDDDWTACQAVGHAAWFLDLEGVIAPSATGEGLVVAAFETRVPPGALTLASTVPLTPAEYGAE